MSKILFFTGLILIIIWAIEFLGFHVTGIIHLLFAVGVILLLIRLFYNKSVLR